MNKIKTEKEYTVLYRDDGKIILSSEMVYDHIGTHGKIGKGSVFSGGITPDMINNFLLKAEIPDSGGGITADFPGGGYLLVAPFESAMKLRDAKMYEGSKEDFDPKVGKMVPIPVAEVHTSQSIEDFSTDVTTVLVFPYDPARSSDAQNSFVESTPDLAAAKAKGMLYALATAFPGGFQIEGQTVPRAPDWGGIKDPKWAVIIPDSPKNQIIERWNKLAGTE